MAQFVYSMQGVTKIVPPKRVILENIWLSFFPGAKIGVLGLNGSGKSSLLRIMAGVDTEFEGEARPQKGIRIGYLPQEVSIFRGLSVEENILAVLEITHSDRRRRQSRFCGSGAESRAATDGKDTGRCVERKGRDMGLVFRRLERSAG